MTWLIFGLDQETNQESETISTMNQILSNANANDVSEKIRKEIDQDFANEVKTDEIFQITWEDEHEVLDAVKESERIRNQNFEGEPIGDGEVPIKIETIKKKKKKRFFFF